jgi:hypothetical protein
MIFNKRIPPACVCFTGFSTLNRFGFDTMSSSDHGRLHFYCSYAKDQKMSLNWTKDLRQSFLVRKENERVY